jgi:hypothetical protein
MGCDIHAHIEVKIKGRWEHYSCPTIQRWYKLFGKIAGVRDEDVEPIAPLRGVPPDINIVTMLDAIIWGTNAHHHTWLTRDELTAVIRWHEEQLGKDGYMAQHCEWGYLYGNYYGHSESHPSEIEDIRLICWFDN